MALQQNNTLRGKLARIHAESDVAEIPVLAAPQEKFYICYFKIIEMTIMSFKIIPYIIFIM